MKITVEQNSGEELEVILRCREVDEEVLRLLALLRSGLQKLCVWDEGRQTVLLNPAEVVWCETVEDHTFVYTTNALYQTGLSLGELESRWGDLGFFRAGKSVVVNLHHIRSLKSCGGGRIEAALPTGERLMVSRHYAPLLRQRRGQEGSV